MIFHQPVMVEELLGCIDPAPGKLFVDATVGGGGHAAAVLERSGPDGRLIGLDVDDEAVAAAGAALVRFGDRVRLLRANYADLKDALETVGWGKPDAVYFDLGVSSRQIDSGERGFSFQIDGPLDMRMDRRLPATAADLLERLDSDELRRLLKDYGEETQAGRIARAVTARRSSGHIRTTGELAELVGRAAGRGVKTLARVFQALRIAVNSELSNLEKGLGEALDVLTAGGALAVISYHSLEDRIAKNFMRDWEKGCICPPEWPVCRCDRTPRLTRPFKRPRLAGEAEIRGNSRARSARLRAAVKL